MHQQQVHPAQGQDRLAGTGDHRFHAMLNADGLADDAKRPNVDLRQHLFRLAVIGGRVHQPDARLCRARQDGAGFRRRHLAAPVGDAVGLAELDRADAQTARHGGTFHFGQGLLADMPIDGAIVWLIAQQFQHGGERQFARRRA